MISSTGFICLFIYFTTIKDLFMGLVGPWLDRTHFRKAQKIIEKNLS